ncbi:M20/M25/M40 family metallo-hydrolase [Gramella sp. AN32]|uniref:M28 family metallopeptidase n=1 Tax=Christiangramia antarctica TaxID=2058158 RepID=A0ABW5X505_9FLAO|nr:M20/M25/M40 family metallo-hydrolase [Gramella sp. AN32]MCM4157475.1 peptidase M28 [Gramella sp. AN32]
MRNYQKSLKTFILFSFLSLLISCSAQEPIPVKAITAHEIEKDLTFLSSDDLNGRKTGTEGIEKAAEFIEERFKKLDLPAYFENYRDDFKIDEIDGFNMVAVLEGNDENLKNEFILIGAHYDHIGSSKPVEGDSIANGANDNAAGTVGVLQLAEVLANSQSNKRSIIFALFSGEEMGLRGSQHLAARLKSENLDLYTMLNLEMIGVPMKAKDYEAYVTGFENSNLAEKFNEYSNDKKILGFLPQAKQLNLFKRSDNYPFYEQLNIPAQTISTFDFSNYNYYHHVDDEIQFMDPEHMAKLLNDLVPGIQKMANTSAKEITLNE